MVLLVISVYHQPVKEGLNLLLTNVAMSNLQSFSILLLFQVPTKDSRGKPITNPKQIYGGPTSSGVVASSYFSKPGYVSVGEILLLFSCHSESLGDQYIDPDKLERKYQAEKEKKAAFKIKDKWVPAGGDIDKYVTNQKIRSD